MYVRERKADSIWETAPAFFVMKSPYMLSDGCSLERLAIGRDGKGEVMGCYRRGMVG